jgi:WD40 repeat protein
MLIATGLLSALSAGADKPLAETLPVVISAGADHDIKQWDGTGKLVTTLGSHDDAVNALLLVDSDTLISVGADGACKIWSISGASMTLKIDAVKGSALSVAITPSKSVLAIGTAGGKIDLFLRSTGKKLAEADAHNDGVRALRFSSDGATLFSASADRQMRFWRVTINGSKAALDYQSNISAHDEAVNGLVVSPDDRTIATISSDGYLKTWQRNGGGLVNRVKVCEHGASAVAYSPDGRTLATGDADGKVRLWNAAALTPISTLGSHERAVTCLAWSSDGKFVVSGGEDKTLRYWSLDQGKQAARIAAHDGTVKAVVVLP